MQPTIFAPARHQPAGAFFVDHFSDPNDRRTHLERITPLDGDSFGYCPGAGAVFERQPMQTLNGSDVVIPAQIA